jgi:hypothetical protein
MNTIGLELAAPAIGVAVSPLPIMIVLLLIIARNVRSAVSYVLGWIIGLLVVGILLVQLSNVTLHTGDRSESTAMGIASIVMGLFFLAMAFFAYSGRNRKKQVSEVMLEKEAGELAGILHETETQAALKTTPPDAQTTRDMALATATPMTMESGKPGWMSAIDKVSPLLALVIALVSAFNPKNLSMILIAIADIHEAGFGPTRGSIAYLNFVALATVTVAAPLIYWLVRREEADQVLQKCERWLSANQAYIMTVLFLVLGVMAIVKGWRRLPG